MNILFADLPLVQRLEAAEAQGSVVYAEALARLHPDDGTAVKQIAGGHAVFAGVGSFFSQAKGMGMNGDVTEADIEELEDFYFSRGAAAQVVLCPLADSSLLKLLGQRGYRVAEFENELFRPLSDDTIAPQNPEIDIRQATADDGDVFVHIVVEGFFGAEGASLDVVDMFRTMFRVSPGVSFLASINGEPVGGAGMATFDGVANLFGASTLPAFRNRGVQTALIQARLAFAVAAGCDLAKVTTLPGSGSQRNVERQGFRVAYTRTVMVREKI
jgi:GNAT superfamily N-acetyltransferase